jgi:hypothetical protein
MGAAMSRCLWFSRVFPCSWQGECRRGPWNPSQFVRGPCHPVHRWCEGDLWAPFRLEGTCHYGWRVCVQLTLAHLAELDARDGLDALAVN